MQVKEKGVFIIDNINGRMEGKMTEHSSYKREELPGFIINKASKGITDLLHKNFKEAKQNVTPEQWIVLDELWCQDGLTQLELAHATFRDQTSTSRIIDNLVKRNLVYRSSNPLDKRSNLIFLTDNGKKLQKSLIKIVQKTMTDAIDGIDKEDLDTCLNVLNKISNTVSNK